MISKNLEQSYQLEMVLQEYLDLQKFKQEKWLNSDLVSEVWP